MLQLLFNLILGLWLTRTRIDGYSKSLRLICGARWNLWRTKSNGQISCKCWYNLGWPFSLWWQSAQSLREAHSRSITDEQIIKALQIMPFVRAPIIHLNCYTSDGLEQHPAMVRAVTDLKNKGETTFLCLSNANSIFISTILKVVNLTLYINRPLKQRLSGKRTR